MPVLRVFQPSLYLRFLPLELTARALALQTLLDISSRMNHTQLHPESTIVDLEELAISNCCTHMPAAMLQVCLNLTENISTGIWVLVILYSSHHQQGSGKACQVKPTCWGWVRSAREMPP